MPHSIKLAVLSHILPPAPSGQAMVLYRLLKNWEPSTYCLIKTDYRQISYSSERKTTFLRGKLYTLEEPFTRFLNRRNFLVKVVRFFDNRFMLFSPWRIFTRVNQMRAILRVEASEAILVCSGDFENIPAGYIASRKARIPFFLYYFDWYGMQWPTRIKRVLAQWIEAKIITKSSAVIVPNTALRDDLEDRHGVKAIVIQNPCDERTLSMRPVEKWPLRESEYRIVYTGAVYHAHYDAFRNLSSALKDLTNKNIELDLYTSQPQAVLEKQGIIGDVINFHPHLPPDDTLDVQRKADILFLPLAFKSTINEVLRTSAPGKMGEYLASGRPILVHAPPDTFLSRYFQAHRCGVVVSRNSHSDLLQAIRNIIEDSSLRQEIIDNAIERAKQDFNPHLAEEKFKVLFQV